MFLHRMLTQSLKTLHQQIQHIYTRSQNQLIIFFFLLTHSVKQFDYQFVFLFKHGIKSFFRDMQFIANIIDTHTPYAEFKK